MTNFWLLTIWQLISKTHRKSQAIVCILIFSTIAILPALIIELLILEVSPNKTYRLTITHLNDIVISPVFETLIFQLLPFIIAQRLKWQAHSRIIMMIIPFAFIHESGGYLAIANAAYAGGILTLTFHIWATRSIQHAVYMTFCVHATTNAIAHLGDYFIGILL